MDESIVIWAIICFAIAIFLFVIELFIPSGGLIGFVAILSLVAGIVLLFWIDSTYGLIALIVSLTSLPFLFAFAIKVWPDTPIGKMLTLSNEGTTAVDAVAETSQHVEVGQTGKSLSPLRPVGTCLIEGERIECISAAGVIDSQTEIRVVDVDGTQVKVRPVENV